MEGRKEERNERKWEEGINENGRKERKWEEGRNESGRKEGRNE